MPKIWKCPGTLVATALFLSFFWYFCKLFFLQTSYITKSPQHQYAIKLHYTYSQLWRHLNIQCSNKKLALNRVLYVWTKNWSRAKEIETSNAIFLLNTQTQLLSKENTVQRDTTTNATLEWAVARRRIKAHAGKNKTMCDRYALQHAALWN